MVSPIYDEKQLELEAEHRKEPYRVFEQLYNRVEVQISGRKGAGQELEIHPAPLNGFGSFSISNGKDECYSPHTSEAIVPCVRVRVTFKRDIIEYDWSRLTNLRGNTIQGTGKFNIKLVDNKRQLFREDNRGVSLEGAVKELLSYFPAPVI